MTNCMKLVGKFNNLFTWGLKEVTLKYIMGYFYHNELYDN